MGRRSSTIQMEVQGITAGVNMWDLLRDDDPGESATFLAAIGEKKPAAVVEVEEPAAINGTGGGGKPVKRVAKAKKDSKNKNKNKNKKGTADKQAAEEEEEKEESDGEVQETNGRKGKRGGRKGKEAAASGCCRAIAEQICKAVVAATVVALSYHALLSTAQYPVAGGGAI